jgi:hypothetical protein
MAVDNLWSWPIVLATTRSGSIEEGRVVSSLREEPCDELSVEVELDPELNSIDDVDDVDDVVEDDENGANSPNPLVVVFETLLSSSFANHGTVSVIPCKDIGKRTSL